MQRAEVLLGKTGRDYSEVILASYNVYRPFAGSFVSANAREWTVLDPGWLVARARIVCNFYAGLIFLD